MTRELAELLARAGLADLTPRFEEEDLTASLLRSMGAANFTSSMTELGLRDAEATALATALRSPITACPQPPPGDSAGTDADDDVPASALHTLTVRWQGADLVCKFGPRTTVAMLKADLERRTTVPAPRQRLVGWAARRVDDVSCVAELILAGRRLMLVGTPQAAHSAATADLERGRRSARQIAADLGESQLRPAAAPQCHRPSAAGPVNAAHGGGIYIDPEVWAPDADAEPRRASTRGHPHSPRHVLNPHTHRLEALGLSNALLAERGPGRPGEADQPATNVDLIGTVRGACTACDACPGGYVRRRGGAANENDVDALRCARCGCQCHEHEAL